jgi:hypothetical protein
MRSGYLRSSTPGPEVGAHRNTYQITMTGGVWFFAVPWFAIETTSPRQTTPANNAGQLSCRKPYG